MASPTQDQPDARTVAPGVQVVVDRAAVVAHLRDQLPRLNPETRRELGTWVDALDAEGDQQAAAIYYVTQALGRDDGPEPTRWSYGTRVVYSMAFPSPRGGA